MSIINIPKNTLENLFEPLIVSTLQKDSLLDKIKSNSATFSKLKLLMKQAELLKEQIKDVINEGVLNQNLHEVKCNFQKKSGQTYYLYKKNETYYFSLLSPEDWNGDPPNTFINAYYYDYDKSFQMI